MHSARTLRWWSRRSGELAPRLRAACAMCVCVVGAVLLVGLVGVVGVAPAKARRESTFAYPYSRVWTTAVRLMRVDYAAVITEKDKEDGYFLFEFPDRGKAYPGSMELVAVQADGVDSVRVVLTIKALPSYVENMLMDRLERKLVQEFGPPPERKPEKRPPAGDDGADDTEPDEGGDAEPPADAQRVVLSHTS